MRDADTNFSKSVGLGDDMIGLIVGVGSQKFFTKPFIFRIDSILNNGVEMLIESTRMILLMMIVIRLIDLIKFIE